MGSYYVCPKSVINIVQADVTIIQRRSHVLIPFNSVRILYILSQVELIINKDLEILVLKTAIVCHYRFYTKHFLYHQKLT